MTDDERETFDSIIDYLKWDAVWWTTMLLIVKLNYRPAPWAITGTCRQPLFPSSHTALGIDSAWDAMLQDCDALHDAGFDDEQFGGVW